ncbi:apoptosis-associated speck-like protein containing a CARD [Osmerus mordax]|uniref:apoptosis-associated speck-like protein containing a CARD n=1 Tax=Osmerus mordax TaxID=8014 RepID=UPI003510AAD4
MASVKLLNILDELTSDNLKTFKWHLKNGIDGFPAIPVSQLETADRTDVVDKMEQHYKPEGSVQITLLILERMKQINLAEELRKAYGVTLAAAPALNPGPPPQPFGRDFLKTHKAALETRINSLAPLLRGLESKQILNEEEREDIESQSTSTKKNQALLTNISRKGNKAQDEFYQVLKTSDPYLVEDLEKTS